MALFDIFRSKEDPKVRAIERRAYEKELKKVHREKRKKAIQEAGERGRMKARGIKTGTNRGEKLIGAAKGIAGGIIKVGKYGASLNWEGEVPSREIPVKKGRKGKTKKQTYTQYKDPFDMPEFPF